MESPPDTAVIDVVPNQPGLEIEKVVDASHPYQAGDTVTYRYVVRNSGNTTITGVTVADDRVSGITCLATTLDPGGTTTCTGSYTVTQEDAERGTITNTAVATADGVRSEPAEATVQVTEKPCKDKECDKPCEGKHCDKE
ncbi:DUF11 domain-containing protein [Streptomyces sp. NBC_01525]|uniref:DUF7507 domain-containing protein n=1 Tax=Streptomyces sp. NBC_01525 TaxID=2903893 RepID=UPI00386EACD6